MHANLMQTSCARTNTGQREPAGMMQGLELVRDRQTKEPAASETTQLMERARSNGLLIGKGGLYANVIRLAPPLNISKADVDAAILVLDRSLSEIRT